MTNRIFQSVVHQMKDAINGTVGVIDESGVIVACSELSIIGETINGSQKAFESNECVKVAGKTFKTLGSRVNAEFAAFVEGEDFEAQRLTNLVCISLENIKQCYDEKYDRGNFVKNVILDNILPGDIFLKARELRFNSDASRVVILIKIFGNERCYFCKNGHSASVFGNNDITCHFTLYSETHECTEIIPVTECGRKFIFLNFDNRNRIVIGVFIKIYRRFVGDVVGHKDDNIPFGIVESAIEKHLYIAKGFFD